MKKTLKQWEKSSIDLDKFLGDVPCEVDEDMVDYMRDITMAQYSSPLFMQT